MFNSFHLNFFVSTKTHGEAFEGIVTSVKLKQYIHTLLFGILSVTHYVLKTKEAESGISSLYSILSKDNDGECLFLSTAIHANVIADYIHLPSLLIINVQSSDATQSTVTFKLPDNR